MNIASNSPIDTALSTNPIDAPKTKALNQQNASDNANPCNGQGVSDKPNTPDINCDEPVMNLHIMLKKSYEVNSQKGKIVQILFDGTVDGPLFNGIILPGGVDTQYWDNDNNGTLNARYILDGHDFEGLPCKIFVENRAVAGNSTTSPIFYTDSSALSYIEDASFVGEMCHLPNEFVIKIYQKHLS